jgi:SAM-dependent methyltransferase
MRQDVYQTFAVVEDEHWWFRGRRRFIDRLVQRFVGTAGEAAFCEVGCGTGGNLAMLSSHAPVDAIEMEAYAREYAQARAVPGVRSVQDGSLPDNLPLEGPYKAVFALDVIEHLQQDRRALETLGKLLADDGVLVITVPAYQWMWSRHDEINHHVRRYARTQIVEVVEAAGLQVVYSSYFNTLLAPVAMLARSLERVFGGREASSSSVGLNLPPGWLNRLLSGVFGLEQYLAGRVCIPFGLSVAVVATRRA